MNNSNVLKNFNFLLLLQGQTVSRIGSILFRVIISWYILELTESGLAMTTYIVFESIPRSFIKLFSGVIVDRLNKKFIICITDIINGINMFIIFMTIIYIKDISLKLLIIYVLAVVKGVTDAFFSPAINSIIPDIVEENHIHQAFAFNQSSYQISGIFGLVIGLPILLLFGVDLIVLFNGISFIISGVSEMFIKYSYKNNSNIKVDDIKSSLKDIKHNFYSLIKYISTDKNIKSIIVFGILISVSTVALINPTQIYILKKYLNSNVDSYMFISIIAAIGSLISSVIIGFTKKSNKIKLVLVVSQLFIVLCILIYSILNISIVSTGNINNLTFFLISVTIGLISFCSPIVGVGISTLAIKNLDRSMIGGFMGVQGCITELFTSLVLFFSGALVDTGLVSFVIYFMLGMNIVSLIYLISKVDKDKNTESHGIL